MVRKIDTPKNMKRNILVAWVMVVAVACTCRVRRFSMEVGSSLNCNL